MQYCENHTNIFEVFKLSEKLEILVSRAYDLFKGYKICAPLDVCTKCCLTTDEENGLVTLGVRHIPQPLLCKWNHAAKTTHPALNEFKHFLPRFLELIAHFNWPSHSVEITLKSFEYYSNNDWSKQEKKLVEEFGREYFRYCLEIFPLANYASMDEILIMLWKANINISPLLTMWKDAKNKEAVMHFSTLIDNVDLSKGNSFSNAFAAPDPNGEISSWLNEPEIIPDFVKKIEKLILGNSDIDEDILVQLSYTHEILSLQ